jgi:hypothetical protein
VEVIRFEVSLTSDCNSASRRASWVVAKAGMGTGSRGGMVTNGMYGKP